MMECTKEKHLVQKWRGAITDCKKRTGITESIDLKLDEDQKMSMEKCMISQYLIKQCLN